MSKRPKLLERREGVIGTARWLAAAAHVAESNGLKDVTVSIKDLYELTGFMQAVEHVEIRESAKIRLGYCRSDQIREMQSQQKRCISTIICKTDRYDTEVYITRLPKPVVLDDDQIPMDAVEISSLADGSE